MSGKIILPFLKYIFHFIFILFSYRDVMVPLVIPTLHLIHQRTEISIHIPKEVSEHMEPDGELLRITIVMSIHYVRDVPDSGGSFGVVFRLVLLCNIHNCKWKFEKRKTFQHDCEMEGWEVHTRKQGQGNWMPIEPRNMDQDESVLDTYLLCSECFGIGEPTLVW